MNLKFQYRMKKARDETSLVDMNIPAHYTNRHMRWRDRLFVTGTMTVTCFVKTNHRQSGPGGPGLPGGGVRLLFAKRSTCGCCEILLVFNCTEILKWQSSTRNSWSYKSQPEREGAWLFQEGIRDWLVLNGEPN